MVQCAHRLLRGTFEHSKEQRRCWSRRRLRSELSADGKLAALAIERYHFCLPLAIDAVEQGNAASLLGTHH